MNLNIPQYDFYKHKYGDELLIDVVPLNTIKKYLKEQPVHNIDVLRYNIDH